MSNDPTIADVIRTIAEGATVDWDSVDGTAADASIASFLEELKVIARIADVHGTAGRGSAAADRSPDEELRSWGPLTILERVGDGSYGVVYRAWDSRLDREVALKLLRHTEPAASDTPTVHEGRLLARVHHPNVVTVHGADRIDNRVGIWMEFVDGRTLEQIVREDGPLNALEAAQIGVAVARGLAAVHQAGLLHRDVKAQNVIRQQDGRIVLMDFGAGREAGDCEGAGFAGTPLYLAPETLAGSPSTEASDVYSVGVLLYYLVTGKYPITGTDLKAVRAMLASGEKVPLRAARADVPKRFAEIIEKAISHDPTGRLRTAAALESELSSFIASTDPSLVAGRRRRGLATAAALLVAIALGASAVVGWGRYARTPVAFNANDWVLVTAFENKTGDPVLDDTIEFAFQRELTNSRYAHVVSRDRVDAALRLMRRPANSTLDVLTGREICVRDGDIRALITGRIDKIADKYVLTSQIVNPVDGVVSASFADDDLNAAQLLSSVRRQALQIRDALGEAHETVASSRHALQKVTTSSLRAVQLYSAAYPMVAGRTRTIERTAAAEPLLREALAIDPALGPAEVLLAWVIHNRRPRPPAPDEYLSHVDNALKLADSASEFERQFILANAHSLRADAAMDPADKLREREGAVAAYEAVLQIQPDNTLAQDNAKLEYGWMGRGADIAQMFVRIADNRPHSFDANFAAATTSFEEGNRATAERYLIRATALAPVSASPANADSAVAVLRAADAWVRRDVHAAARELDRTESSVVSASDQNGPSVGLREYVRANLALGRLGRAETLARRTVDPSWRTTNLAMVLAVRHNWTELRTELQAARDRSDPLARGASYLVDAGMLDDARRLVRDIQDAGGLVPSYRLFIEQAIAARERRFSDTVRLGEASLKASAAEQRYDSLKIASNLADAYLALNRPDAAVRILEVQTARPSASVSGNFSGGFEWLRARARLAEVYRLVGREADARGIEDDLMQLLTLADADDPLLVELNRRIAARR